ncbi:MAG TPA: SHOCT domain-containing protein [Spirochaetia bacterium]|nr:SHOCT domain-containing protein [Spirochaetia bacterium]
MWGWGWMHGLGWGHPIWWALGGLRLAFVAAVIVGIVFVVRAVSRRGGWGGAWPREESALDILQKRYARGEITKEQYEEMKNNLG